MINKKDFGAEAKVNNELMSRRLVAKSGYDLEGKKILNDNDIISIPEKNKELIAKLEKELEKDKEQDKDLVPDWYDGPEGSKYYPAGPKTLRLVPTKNINNDIKFNPLGKLREHVQIKEEIPIIKKEIEIEKENDIEKDINKEEKDSNKKEEENISMAEQVDALLDKLKVQDIQKKLEEERFKALEDRLNIQRKEIEDDVDQKYNVLDKKVCNDEECRERERKETQELIAELRNRISYLEKPAFICDQCGYGIIREGDTHCSNPRCDNQVKNWGTIVARS